MSTHQLIESFEAADLSDEEYRIRSWRMEQFRSLGLEFVASALLAESDADLALARRLVARGCSPELAARILL